MIQNYQGGKSFFVVVLGPHRSGSSVTTKILQSLGCNLGGELLEGHPSFNPLGHFENLKVLEFHEELLKALGTDWKDPIPLLNNFYFSRNRHGIENSVGSLLESLIELNITAVKEPRMSIVLDIWKDAFSRSIPNLKIILTVRHPAEVALSLQERDNLSQIIGLQLWVQATLNAIKFARDKSNYFVFYDQLVTEPQVVTSNILQYLEALNPSGELNALAAQDVVVEYRNNKVNDGESAVLNLATEMYKHIRKFDSATSLSFGDELLDDWGKRIQSIYKEINRPEIIRGMDLQRDQIAADRDRITQELTTERDQIAADRDRITQELTTERDQIAADRDRITQERDDLLNSTIWKGTKVLRWAVNSMRKIIEP